MPPTQFTIMRANRDKLLQRARVQAARECAKIDAEVERQTMQARRDLMRSVSSKPWWHS